VIRAPSPILETLSENPEDADTLGYSRSKWVAEAICVVVSKSSLLGSVKVVRVGQLTGDTVNGVWNMSEAWPLMLSTVRELNCLPKIKQNLDWLPLDVAADAVVEIALQEKTREAGGESVAVYHVLNNYSVPNWDNLLEWIEKFWSHTFEVVKPKFWLYKLERAENSDAKKLSWLWDKAYGDDDNASYGFVKFQTERANKQAKAMREFTGLNEEILMRIWLWIEDHMYEGKK
jgi:thioester reductase-like protein